MSESSDSNRFWRRLHGHAWFVLTHGIAVCVLSVLSLLPFSSSRLFSAWEGALSHEATRDATLWQLLIHVGLCTCVWALFVIAWRLLKARRRDATKAHRVVRAAKGTVATETLIVLVPFLLLTSGLAQLTILNISSVLAHLAIYQAGRTAWVWSPEARKGRMGVGTGTVQERARIAAASSMAPAAPASFQVATGLSGPASQMRGTMYAFFDLNDGHNSGAASLGPANAAAGGGDSADADNLFYHKAFDVEAFPQRAARKFTMAYHATTVNVGLGGSDVTADLTYQQNVVFPWFAWLWGGSQQTIGGRSGYYVPLRRSISFPALVDL